MKYTCKYRTENLTICHLLMVFSESHERYMQMLYYLTDYEITCKPFHN